jgi:hypothetical protein
MPSDPRKSPPEGGPEPAPPRRGFVAAHPEESATGRGSALVWVIALGATAIFWALAVALLVRLLS